MQDINSSEDGVCISLPLVNNINISFEFLKNKKLYIWSPQLRKFMKKDITTRIDILNYFSKYINDNNLLSKDGIPSINWDENLKDIFKLNTIPLNELGIFIKNNIQNYDTYYNFDISLNNNISKIWQNHMFDLKVFLPTKTANIPNIDPIIKEIDDKIANLNLNIKKYKKYSLFLKKIQNSDNLNEVLKTQRKYLNIAKDNEQKYLDKRNIESSIFMKNIMNDFPTNFKKDLLDSNNSN